MMLGSLWWLLQDLMCYASQFAGHLGAMRGTLKQKPQGSVVRYLTCTGCSTEPLQAPQAEGE